jgi:hypothetical protein
VDCAITNDSLSLFSRVRNLNLSMHHNCEEIFDVSKLTNLETGSFQIRNCINYNSLMNLKSLEITSCDTITDVSCFRNIPKLTLSDCQNIMNISSLANVNELDLSYNDKLTDVSALSNVHKLNLSYCNNLGDISCLQNVHILDISGCVRVTDVSGLKNVVDLDILSCNNITDIKMLTTLRKLNMKRCDKISDLSTLTNLQILELDNSASLFPSVLAMVRTLAELTIDEDFLVLPSPDSVPAEAQSILSGVNFHVLSNIPVLSFFHCPLPFQKFSSFRYYDP